MEPKRKYLSDTGGLLEVGQGDITFEETEAIVNAANSQLSHGGGVARAIAKEGGEVITRESREWVAKHGPVTFDSPAYTKGGNLPAKFVIHAVGPVWGEGDEDKKLATAIHSSLKLAEKLGVKSIAFPAISTGIFGFPVDRAADIFMKEFKDYLSKESTKAVKTIDMILYDDHTLEAFIKAFDKFFHEPQIE